MKVVRSDQVAPKSVDEEGAKGTTVRWLIARPDGAPNFAMRVFEVEPGGSTPRHKHAWEHEVYILDGTAEVVTDSGPVAVSQGDAVLVLPEERHQFRNAGSGTARFLCMVPLPPED